jgi:hypothetical protein
MSNKKKKPSIDRVSTTTLDIALRSVGYKLDMELIDKIIDLVELLEVKGDNTSLADICKLEAVWEKTYKTE